MMKLLIPLGLLGLIGLLVLLLIYIIKPNFLIKYTSSNYIWKLALKYKRKRLVTNKLRNILIIICQVLIIGCMALILAQPVLDNSAKGDSNESVIIIDSSASMRTADEDGVTRYERAIKLAIDRINDTVGKKSVASVILADADPRYLASRLDASNAMAVIDDLLTLQSDNESCSYSTADISGAMRLCEDIVNLNPDAKIYLYTDADYASVPDSVSVVNVAKEGEWNLGILGATAQLDGGHYAVTVQVGLYGKSGSYPLQIEVEHTDGSKETLTSDPLFFAEDVPATVIFTGNVGTDIENRMYYVEVTGASQFAEFNSIRAYFDDPQDSFEEDDEFYIYGGKKEQINIQYVSNDPNPFFEVLLNRLPGDYADRWDVRVKIVSLSDYNNNKFATVGYDFYIFEHADKLTELPTDGVSLIIDPPFGNIPGLSVTVTGTRGDLKNELHFSSGEGDAITGHINADNIFVTQYSTMTYDSAYSKVLMYCENNPAALLIDGTLNGALRKAVVMPFSVHYSNIARRPEFVYLMYGIFDHFFPPTVQKYSYEVNENVTLNCRGPEIEYNGEKYGQFPLDMKFAVPGTYTFKQSSYFGKDTADVKIYVNLPKAESNIFATATVLEAPVADSDAGSGIDDLLIWFAAGLVALLFAEWLLHSFENR